MGAPGALTLARDWGRAVVDFVYPPACPLCHRRLTREDRTVCLLCEAQLKLRPDWQCPRCGGRGCGAPPESGRRCRLCPPGGAAWLGALSVVGYSDFAARCVHLFKYNRRLELGGVMARLMAEHLAEPVGALGGRLDRIAPVPLHWARRLARGFNQSERLARALAAATGLELDTRLLRRLRHTKRQALVPKDLRAENVRGAFGLRAGREVRRQGILLVDDVVTTGETVNECAKALKDAGAREVWVACFARAGVGRGADEE